MLHCCSRTGNTGEKAVNRLRLFVASTLGLCAALGVYACGDGTTDPPAPDPPRATAVTVTPATAELTALGATVRLSANIRDQNGQAMAGATVEWSSSDAAVATVDAGGLVTAAGNGQTTVTAASGQASSGVRVTVEQQAVGVELSPSTALLLSGDTLRIIASAVDANGHAIAGAGFTWTTSDTTIATVDPTGLVTARGLGAVTVSAVVNEIEARADVLVEAANLVAFADDSVYVAEGETRVVGVRYRVRNLDAPLAIRVSVLEDGAEEADYELSETRFEIPAGSGLEGAVELTVGAVADPFFAEGDEGVSLHLAVPEESEVEVGSALRMTIADAPVSACVGVSLAGTPPRLLEGGRDLVGSALTLEWGPEAADVQLEWAGPYPTREESNPNIEHHPYFQRGITRPNQPGFHVSDWRIESNGDAARHTMSLEWPADDALSLRLRSPRGTCDGEPLASCGPDGCFLDREAEAAGDSGLGAGRIPKPGDVTTVSVVRRPPIGSPTEVMPSMDVVPSTEVAAYHMAECQWGRTATTDNVQLWSPAAWPPGETLEWFVSRANWPTNAVQSPETIGAWIQQSVFDEFSAIPTADARMRMAGLREADEAPEPTRDGVNTIHLTDGHGGTHIYGDIDPETGCFQVTESDVAMGGMGEFWVKRTDAQLAEISMSHDFGHALRLEHAAAFPVWRFPTGRWNLENWRAARGVWPLDPSMSYGSVAHGYLADESGSFLAWDDEIAISLVRPRPGWLASTGSISGRIHADGSPKPFVHVWALLPNADGTVDGVGAFANENGAFRIEGLPAGDYYLWASPDLEWLANPWFFFEGQGELLDVLLPFPIRVVAGQATDGIQINMRSGRPAALIK